MAQHNELGKEGEQQAIQYLREKAYIILEKNYRFKKAEIDIIAQKGDVLVIVEVKTRSTDYFGNPEEFIDKKKIKLLVTAADHYVIDKDLDVEVRFDIVAILRKGSNYEIEHMEDAFLFF